ncbi:MAG: KTSC domain-containing protein [Pseudomonadota bacterium]
MPSRVIRSWDYDPAGRVLAIVFHSGWRYSYRGVPARTYEEFERAPSKGSFFNLYIRDAFPFVRDDVRQTGSADMPRLRNRRQLPQRNRRSRRAG